jgi:hypothetical protein
MIRRPWVFNGLAALSVLLAATPAWSLENVCPYGGQSQTQIAQILRVDYNAVPRLAEKYCANVGRNAYNAIGPDRVRNIDLGPILGVVWVTAGEAISENGRALQFVPISGFMYVIGPGGVANHKFLRWGSDIEGR